MSTDPRPYTREECRRMFLDQIRVNVEYWSTVDPPEGPLKTKERLDGLAFSMLTMLDGMTDLPGFDLIPHPHPDDSGDRESIGENWWPDDVDIAGGLHDEWHKR